MNIQVGQLWYRESTGVVIEIIQLHQFPHTLNRVLCRRLSDSYEAWHWEKDLLNKYTFLSGPQP